MTILQCLTFGFNHLHSKDWTKYLTHYALSLKGKESPKTAWTLKNGQIVDVAQNHLGIFREVFDNEPYKTNLSAFFLINIGCNAGLVEAYYESKGKDFRTVGIDLVDYPEYGFNSRNYYRMIGNVTRKVYLNALIKETKETQRTVILKIDIEGAEYLIPKKYFSQLLALSDELFIEYHQPLEKARKLKKFIEETHYLIDYRDKERNDEIGVHYYKIKEKVTPFKKKS